MFSKNELCRYCLYRYTNSSKTRACKLTHMAVNLMQDCPLGVTQADIEFIYEQERLDYLDTSRRVRHPKNYNTCLSKN